MTMLMIKVKQHVEAEVQVNLSDNLLKELEMQVKEMREKPTKIRESIVDFSERNARSRTFRSSC